MAPQDPSTRDLVPGFAALITAARTERGWSMADLSRESGIGTSSVSAIEREIRAPSLRVALALLDALGKRSVRVGDLLNLTAEEAGQEPAAKKKGKGGK